MPLFAKGGGDSINIAGHKIPIALLGGAAALVTVIMVIRARQNNSGVASLGTQPANTGVNPVVDTFSSTSPDISGQLANITSQLTNLQNTSVNSTTPSSVTDVIAGNASTIGWDFTNSQGQHGVPLYAMGANGQLISTDLVGGYNSLFQETGAPITLDWFKGGKDQGSALFYPVSINGMQYYISDIQGTTKSING